MKNLQFFSNQLESKIHTHMQTLKEVKSSATHLCRCTPMLGDLYSEFSRRFEDLKNIEDKMHLVFSLLALNADNAPIDVQLELIGLAVRCSTGKAFQVSITAGVLFISQGREFSKHEETYSEDVGSLSIHLCI